jgi:hypothetical protein
VHVRVPCVSAGSDGAASDDGHTGGQRTKDSDSSESHGRDSNNGGGSSDGSEDAGSDSGVTLSYGLSHKLPVTLIAGVTVGAAALVFGGVLLLVRHRRRSNVASVARASVITAPAGTVTAGSNALSRSSSSRDRRRRSVPADVGVSWIADGGVSFTVDATLAAQSRASGSLRLSTGTGPGTGSRPSRSGTSRAANLNGKRRSMKHGKRRSTGPALATTAAAVAQSL